jgi:uncharacterized membrane protein
MLYAFLVLIVVVINYFVGKEFEKAAKDKGYFSSKYFWLVFLLGVYGCLLVIALPDRGSRGNNQSMPSIESNPDMPEL